MSTGAAERGSELVLHPRLEPERRFDTVRRRGERRRIEEATVQGPDSTDDRDTDGRGSAQATAGRNEAPEANVDGSSGRGGGDSHRQKWVGRRHRVPQIDDRFRSAFVDQDPGMVRRQVDRADGHLHTRFNGNVGHGSPHGEPGVGPAADVGGADGSADGDRWDCLAQRPNREATIGRVGDTTVPVLPECARFGRTDSDGPSYQLARVGDRHRSIHSPAGRQYPCLRAFSTFPPCLGRPCPCLRQRERGLRAGIRPEAPQGSR